jgi:uncharacterized membrane protein (UPF0127 family)
MIKQILLAIGIFIVIAALGFAFLFVPSEKTNLIEIKVGEASFNVEIADTPTLRAKGLSGRDYLPTDSGMLFVFPYSAVEKFWMKGMKFPIDIIWIKEDLVVGMTIGAEPEEGPDYTIYSSPEAIDKVLEINAGLVQKLGIKVGDIVSF